MINSIGIIKWYGGINHNTGTLNKFGFIDTVYGEDVYINEKNILDKNNTPKENDVVLFDIEITDKGKQACSLILLNVSSNHKVILQFITILLEYKYPFINKEPIKELLNTIPYYTLLAHNVTSEHLIYFLQVLNNRNKVNCLDIHIQKNNLNSHIVDFLTKNEHPSEFWNILLRSQHIMADIKRNCIYRDDFSAQLFELEY